MNINDFINKFKSELDNDDAAVTPETDYVNSDFWDLILYKVSNHEKLYKVSFCLRPVGENHQSGYC